MFAPFDSCFAAQRVSQTFLSGALGHILQQAADNRPTSRTADVTSDSSLKKHAWMLLTNPESKSLAMRAGRPGFAGRADRSGKYAGTEWARWADTADLRRGDSP
jgi:hypothetical protein